MKMLFAAVGVTALAPLAAFGATGSGASPVWLKLSAYTAIPGAKISAQAACEDVAGPLASRGLRVISPLARNAAGHQPWALFGELVVADVSPGTYPVSFTCAGVAVTVRFTVPRPHHRVSAQVRVVPRGAPQTGGGDLAQDS